MCVPWINNCMVTKHLDNDRQNHQFSNQAPTTDQLARKGSGTHHQRRAAEAPVPQRLMDSVLASPPWRLRGN
jgi:hypothetical protein